jgi:tetratricopeptide (TPR) repeat protein
MKACAMGSLMHIALRAANLHYDKQYGSAIKLLDSYFKSVTDKEDLAQFHITYAMNYDKLKDIEKCNYHCEEAVKLKHFGTYAYERLIKNYVKSKDWENALRIIDIVFKNEKLFDHRKFFEDKPSQWDDISSYALKRKSYILGKIK